MKQRIGVYICHCGGNISDYVDVESISKAVRNEDIVIISKDVMFACADSNQKEMINDIRDNNLDAIVVASCSPKLHLHTFRNVAQRAGINAFNYVQVNIREQCSWPHSDKSKEATFKASGLIQAGINRVSYSESLENIEISAKKAALVIGAGVSGMRAAIDLAKLGNEVFIIEKDHFVGGQIAKTGRLFPTGKDGKEIVTSLYHQMKALPNITIFTGATIEKLSGSVGNFTATIKILPRYIVKNPDQVLLNQAIDECPGQIQDEFNYGFTSRKSIYTIYEGAFPDHYVVDKEALKSQSAFLEKYRSCIDINQKPEFIEINFGSVLVTTGHENYQPNENDYSFGKINQVITLPELKRLLELKSSDLKYGGKIIQNISFIYCVGNRQTKGENKYCSRTCCTSAIHTSLLLHEQYKDIKVTHFFRDIRTYGKQEILFEKSSKQGDLYIRFDEKEPPVVEQSGNKINIKVKDFLTDKNEVQLETDLVVLVTGSVSSSSSTDIAGKLKIPIGTDRFFNEIHPKLRPVETVIRGIFIGGSCQGPKNISEAVQSALSGVAKINALLKSGTIALEPVIARINNDNCMWCGKCADVCEYDSISEFIDSNKSIAVVNKATCKGCGICAPVCPYDAIEIAQFTNNEIEGMIDGFMQEITVQPKEKGETYGEEKQATEMKEYPQIWKQIISSISSGSKTIPEIAIEISSDPHEVTYHLMTMNKYNLVTTDGLDDSDAYYYYKNKN